MSRSPKITIEGVSDQPPRYSDLSFRSISPIPAVQTPDPVSVSPNSRSSTHHSSSSPSRRRSPAAVVH